MRKFIWICDRCGMEIEPRVLDKGEMYITRKKDVDIDLCEYCLKSLSVWFNQRPIPKFVEDKTYTDTDCMDEDAKHASIPCTYNAPQHDWKCGYPDVRSSICSATKEDQNG